MRRDLRSRYREDYRVLAAGSGESALDAIKDLKTRGDALAIVIADQRMPSMLGVDVLAKVTEFYPLARRVLLTAYSDVRAAIRAINEAHVDYYLEKPWDAVFVYIGTRPRTEWLPEPVLQDTKGFVLTGSDVALHEAFPRLWKETRPPLPLETSVPGVFAAGDVRSGAMNRVASAAGEGSMAVRLVWEHLSRT